MNKLDVEEDVFLTVQQILGTDLEILSSTGTYNLVLPSVKDIITALGGKTKICEGMTIKLYLHNKGESQLLITPAGITLKGLNTILPTSVYQYWFVIKSEEKIDLYVVSRNDY